MVKLIIGHKGSGKTNQMVELANKEVDSIKGSIIFINKDHRLMYELRHKIRVISTDDFDDITNIDEYIGFIYGMISCDNDLEIIFIDSILKHADVSLGDLPVFIERLKKISDKYALDFVVSISAEKEEMIGVDFSGCEILN